MISRIAKYEIEAELGRGGFGRVYRSYDHDMQRPVAIKVLTESDPELVRRFELEIGTTANLQHKNIVIVYERGQEAGVAYLVMELLPGKTLEQILKHRVALPLIDKVRIMTQVAEGLAYAHSRGVIHRDVKPGNVMVLPDNTVKIMDFGIARVVSSDLRLTRDGFLVGTVPYMAPEQFGAGGNADAQTDIFALGDIYYELLTGVHPFSVAENISATIARIRDVEPEPVTDLVPECPQGLELMIYRALAKDREIRYQRMSELLLDSEAVLSDLKRDLAAAILRGIKPLSDARDLRAVDDQWLQSTDEQLTQVAELDPGNQKARELRQAIGRERKLRAAARRVSELVERSEKETAERRFSEAVETLESALRLNPENAAVKVSLEAARARADASCQANRLVAEARRDQQRGHLDQALQRLQKALDLDQQHGDAQMLVPRIRTEIERRDRERRADEAVAMAETLLAKGRYSEAMHVLLPLLAEESTSDRATELRLRIEREQADDRRRRRVERFNALVAEARAALQDRDSAHAAELLQQLGDPDLAGVPDAAVVITRLSSDFDDLRRAETISAFAHQARELIQRKSFAEAIDVLDQALRRFPGDSGLTRLSASAVALNHAQRRAEALAAVLGEAGALRDAGDLEGALTTIARGEKNTGEDAALREFRHQLEMEREQQRYSAALQSLLDSARRLMSSGRHSEAASVIEASGQFRDEADVQGLLASARAAMVLEEENKVEKETIARVQQLENDGALDAALETVQSTLERYPHNRVLSHAAEHLNTKVREAHRRAREAEYTARIEAAIEERDWASAETILSAARGEFPAGFAQLADRIQRELFNQAINAVLTEVREKLSAQQTDEAADQMALTRTLYAADPRWQLLRQEVERRRDYESGLRQVELSRKNGDLAAAEQRLAVLIAGAPDHRAARLLAEITNERIARQLNEAREIIVRDGDHERGILLLETLLRGAPPEWHATIAAACEQAKAEREKQIEVENARQAIAKARADAREMVQRNEYVEALELLNRCCDQYPDSAELAQNRDAVKLELARHEAAERDRRQRAGAIADARNQAAELVRGGRYGEAREMLSHYRQQYPDSAELSRDLDAVTAELDRRTAAKQAQREREQAIGTARTDAAALVRLDQHAGALDLLNRACQQYPDNAELIDDRNAVKAELDRREAEERVRRERESAIAEARKTAADLMRRDKYAQALELLNRFTERYPDSAELTNDRDAVRAELDRRQAAEQARREREQTIAKARQDAADLVRRDQYANALELLNRADAQYPGSAELARDRDAVKSELGRREAAARAIGTARSEAAALVSRDQYGKALHLLNSAARKYPDSPELVADRDAVRAEIDRRDAAERARRRRDEALVKAQRDAAALVRRDQHAKALALVNRIIAQYPDSAELVRDRDAIKSEMDRRAALQHARLERDAVIAKARKDTAALAGDDQHAKALELLNQVLAQHPDSAELVRDHKAVKAELDRRISSASSQTPVARQSVPLWSQRTRLLAAGLATVAIAVAVSLLWRHPKPDHNLVKVAITARQPGTSIEVAGKTCVVPNCAIELPIGKYVVTARAAGYRTATEELVISRSKPELTVPIALNPLHPRLHVNTNFESGSVYLDGRKTGDLSGGEFSSDVAPGTHTLQVVGGGARFEAQWQAELAAVPRLKAPISATDVDAAVIGNAGARAWVSCNCGVQPIEVDGRQSGTTSVGATAALDLAPGSRRITVGGRARMLDIDPTPTLNVFLSLDRNTGTLVIDPGVENARVSIDGHAYSGPLLRGIARVSVAAGRHEVRVDKDGYRLQPPQVVTVGKGATGTASFKLLPLEAHAPKPFEPPVSRALPPAIPAPVVNPPQPPTVEDVASLAWERVRDSSDPKQLSAFAEKYPGSPHAEEARQKSVSIDTAAREQAAREQAVRDQVIRDQAQKNEQQGITAQQAQAVEGALEAFNTAFRRRKPGALKAIWPSVGPTYVESARLGGPVSLEPVGRPDISGDQATIACNLVSMGKPKPVKVNLQKRGAGWIILKISR